MDTERRYTQHMEDRGRHVTRSIVPVSSPKDGAGFAADIGGGLGEVGERGCVFFVLFFLRGQTGLNWLLLTLFSNPGMFFPSAASLQECLYKAMKSSASDNLKPPF